MLRAKDHDSGKILLLMLGGIGDTIVCTPAMRCIRNYFPNRHIVFLGRDPFCYVIPKNLVDEIIPYPTSPYKKFILGARLGLEKFSLSVDFHTPTINTVCSNTKVFLRNAFFTKAAHAQTRVGFLEGANIYVLNHGVTVSYQDLKCLNITELTARLLPPIGIFCAELPPKEIAVPNNPSKRVHDAWNALDLQTGFAILHLGSKQDAKKWDTNRGMLIALKLYSDFGLKTVIIGDENDKKEGDKIITDLNYADFIINMAGLVTLQDTAWLISRASVAICVDSGPMHMADALKVPLVALFGGQQDNEVWYPVNEKAIVLKGTAPCSPCYRSDCENNICMNEITTEKVLDAVDRLITKQQS